MSLSISPEPLLKVCARCKRALPRTAQYFHRNKQTKDGFHCRCRDCRNKQAVQYRLLVPVAASTTYYQRLRLAVLTAYSGGPPRCACCGETHMQFLALDHVNGGGTKHRRSLVGKGAGKPSAVYEWVKAQGYPPGFRVLCHNCNQAVGLYGVCPHETQRRRAHLVPP